MSMRAVRRIAVITGSRAEFGLLAPVMRAIEAHQDLHLDVLVTGTHLLAPAMTVDEVRSAFPVAATIPMQELSGGASTRAADAMAFGRGVSGFAQHFADDAPDVVLVLGDRIEAFAAASAAAIAGIRVAHMHGGDRAEGIADESMRHAISKLAHIHFPATPQSAERLLCMGESALTVHLVGSPAIDGIDAIAPLDDEQFAMLGSPSVLFLLHPTGESESEEYIRAKRLLDLTLELRAGEVLALHPNHDPGREGILRALAETPAVMQRAHLPREQFIGLLKRVKMIVGNSSAGLIECAALGLPCVNVGSRQAGRMMPGTVIHVSQWRDDEIRFAMERALAQGGMMVRHPYGDGRAGEKTAHVLASFHPDHHPLRKRNTY